MKGLSAATETQRQELGLPGGGSGPARKRRSPLLLDSATKLETLTKAVFNGFGSTDALFSYMEKFRITIASHQAACGRIPESITALNLTFQENTVKGC